MNLRLAASVKDKDLQGQWQRYRDIIIKPQNLVERSVCVFSITGQGWFLLTTIIKYFTF